MRALGWCCAAICNEEYQYPTTNGAGGTFGWFGINVERRKLVQKEIANKARRNDDEDVGELDLCSKFYSRVSRFYTNMK